jgi:hypothetical protein
MCYGREHRSKERSSKTSALKRVESYYTNLAIWRLIVLDPGSHSLIPTRYDDLRSAPNHVHLIQKQRTVSCPEACRDRQGMHMAFLPQSTLFLPPPQLSFFIPSLLSYRLIISCITRRPWEISCCSRGGREIVSNHTRQYCGWPHVL